MACVTRYSVGSKMAWSSRSHALYHEQMLGTSVGTFRKLDPVTRSPLCELSRAGSGRGPDARQTRAVVDSSARFIHHSMRLFDRGHIDGDVVCERVFARQSSR